MAEALNASQPSGTQDLARLSAEFAALLMGSHERIVGAPLTGGSRGIDMAAAAAWLYNDAPFGLLAHDTAPDPCFIYANRTAQRCFGYTWEEFTTLPSRLSATPAAQAERDAFVAAVSARGYACGYRGRRVRKDASQFWIEDVTMWDLVDERGHKQGQAAVFRSWQDMAGDESAAQSEDEDE